MKNKFNEHMWGEGMELQIGMPIILKDAKGLEQYPLWKGQEGMCNQLVNADNQDLVLFMPDNSTRMYYVDESRVAINMDKIEAWEAAQGEGV